MTVGHLMKANRHPTSASPSRRPPKARTFAGAKRELILAAAMPLFADRGYHAARMDDLAAGLGIAKGSIFQHFGSKEALFLEVYKKAARSFSAYLDVAAEIRQGGFFEVLRY